MNYSSMIVAAEVTRPVLAHRDAPASLRRLLRVSLPLLAVAATLAAAPRNILILLADDHGYMDLGANNPKTFYETPHLDRLAASGMRFTDGYAATPVCSPTRYSIQTGKYPTRAGLTNWLPGVRVERFENALLTRQMPLEETTLAEVLRPAGWRTAFVGKWHLGEEEKFWPEAQGFEINLGGHSKGSPASYFSPYKNPRLADGPPGEHLTMRLADETCALLAKFKAEGKPFFLQHCFYDPHTPLQAPKELIEKYRAKAERLGLKDAFDEEKQHFVSVKGPRQVRAVQSHAVYAAMIESMDTAVGKILRALDELGLANDTLVVFTSDNGGLSTSEGLPTCNYPLRAGKGWVYEGGIRTAFLVRMPGAARTGAASAVPVMSIDLFPTALEFAGVPLPAGLAIDGRSLVPLLRGGSAPARDALFWHYPHYSNQGGFPGGAVRMGDWKLVENHEDGSVELYHLRDDLGEKRSRAAAEPERVRAMRARLHAWYRETGAQFLRAKPGGEQPWHPFSP
jgi:arylsulfatase A-like enzyme